MTVQETEWLWRSKGAAAYFALQGIGVGLWWLLLWKWPASQPWFRTQRMSDVALLDFVWPDVAMLCVGSLLCAVLLWKDARSPWSQRLVWLLVGATLYPTLYVTGATFSSGGEGWAATMAMLLAAQGSFLAAWTARPEGSLFRVAPHRSTSTHVLRTFIQTCFFWGAALWLTPWLLLKAEAGLGIPRFQTPWQSWFPWVLFSIAGVGNLLSGYTMSRWGKGTPLPLETARCFVVRGGYRWVRNPMAVTGLFLGAMVGWWLGSWSMLGTVVVGGLLWHGFVRPIEEKDLYERFGEPYMNYCNRIRCWIPAWPPHPPVVYEEILTKPDES